MPDAAGAIRTVAIFGPGLIGGSFGLALQKAGFAGEILGVGASPWVEKAVQRGAVQRAASVDEAIERADLLYLSETIEGILALLVRLGFHVRPDSLVTDVGSTKGTICQQAARLLPISTFVGGHPMAGKEKRGVENADADLFRGRPYVLTSLPESPLGQSLLHWLQRIGATLVVLDATRHDATVALSSHLPQILSTALAYALAGENDLPIPLLTGPGLLDMTRLALSNGDLWNGILQTNRDQVVSAIDRYLETLATLRSAVLSSKLADIFDTAGSYAYLLRGKEK